MLSTNNVKNRSNLKIEHKRKGGIRKWKKLTRLERTNHAMHWNYQGEVSFS